MITCDDCAHCVDLHAPSQNDAKDLTDTRAYEMSTVKKWISEHWRQLNKWFKIYDETKNKFNCLQVLYKLDFFGQW